ncbi:hypothetical protein L9F63_022093, partial [Diploptera punctata]
FPDVSPKTASGILKDCLETGISVDCRSYLYVHRDVYDRQSTEMPVSRQPLRMPDAVFGETICREAVTNKLSMQERAKKYTANDAVQ